MSFSLVCAGVRFAMPRRKLRKLRLFAEHPELLEAPSYEVRCKVSEPVFVAFVDALQGDEVEVTRENFRELQSLCGEFGFGGLDGALDAFKASNPGFEAESSLRADVASLSERVSAQERDLESVKAELLSRKRSSDIALYAVRALEAKVAALERKGNDERREVRVMIDDLGARTAAVEGKRASDVSEIARRIDGVESTSGEGLKSAKAELASLKAAIDSLKSGERAPSSARAAPAPAPAKPSTPARAAGGASRDFRFTGDAFGGIIAALSREYGRNVDEKGVVAVTARDRGNDGVHERYAVDLRYEDTCYRSKDELGAWLCLDFKARRVKPTHYSIRTWGDGKGGNHLKSWVIEGSLDGSGWSELDRRENNEDLNGNSKAKTFPVSKSGEFRFIRLRSIGKNHAGRDYLFCSAFEVFGTLLE